MSLLFEPGHHQAQVPGFSSLFRFLDDFDRHSQRSQHGYAPRFDLVEHDTAYELHGELPGTRKQDVDIEFTDDHTMTVGGRAQRVYEAGSPTAASLPGQSQREPIEGHRREENADADDGAEQRDGGGSGQRYWVSERSFGEFSRVFTFPSRVDPDAVQARLNDGLLTVTVPKAEKKESRRISLIE